MPQKYVLMDQFDEFINASPEALATISHLYLPNAKLGAKSAIDKQKFLANLSQCLNLKCLNLFNNTLNNECALDIMTRLAPLTQLKLVSFRNNNLDEDCIIECRNRASHTCAILITNFQALNPPVFNLPAPGWSLDIAWCEIELDEMLEVAEIIVSNNPMLKKLHAYHDKYEKANLKSATTDKQTFMPISVVFLRGTPHLIPKYSSKQLPSNIYEYNFKSEGSASKKIKLVISRGNTTNVNMAKIKTDSGDSGQNSLKDEEFVLFQTGAKTSATIREYRKRQWQSSLQKKYLITSIIPGEDGFDILMKHLNSITYSKQMSFIALADDKKLNLIQIVLAMFLEGICFHFKGFKHLDIKHENHILSMHEQLIRATLIDFDCALPILDNPRNIYHKKRGTSRYIAPEILQGTDLNFSICCDAYSYGVVARELLYPIISYFEGKCFFTKNSSSAGYRSASQPALKDYFNQGLQLNYGRQIADIIANLTADDPSARENLIPAFCIFANIYPLQASKAFTVKVTEVSQKFIEIIAKHAEAKMLLKQAFSLATINKNSILYAVAYRLPLQLDFTNIEARKSYFNDLAKLETIAYYLCLYSLCNGVLPNFIKDILTKALQELFKKDDFSIFALEHFNHRDPLVECAIKQTFDWKNNTLSIFSCAATELVNLNYTTATAPILPLLNNIQSNIRRLWREQTSPADIATEIAKQITILLEHNSTNELTSKHLINRLANFRTLNNKYTSQTLAPESTFQNPQASHPFPTLGVTF